MHYFLKRFLQGCLMGFTDIVPGVSSTVMALLFGFYEDLLGLYYSVTEVLRIGTKRLGQKPLSSKERDILSQFDWIFVISLSLGYGFAAVMISSGVSYFLNQFPAYVYAVFFAIVLVSIEEIFGRINNIRSVHIIIFCIAVILSGVPILFDPGSGGFEISGFWLVLVGFVVSIGGVVPGLSGGFVLLFFGFYEDVLAFLGGQIALTLDLIILALGAVIGYLVFARYVKRVYESFEQSFLSAVAGLVIGSLWVLWPFVVQEGDSLVRVWPRELSLMQNIMIGVCFLVSRNAILVVKHVAHRNNTKSQ